MTAYTVDLHNHTPFVFSDYREPKASPADLIAAAFAARIDILGVTDHYSLGWWDQMYTAAEVHSSYDGQRLIVLPGAELKVTWGDDEVHLVALFEPEVAVLQFAALTSWLGVASELDDTQRLPYVKAERDPVRVVEQAREIGASCHVAHVDRRFGEYTLLGTPLFDRLLAEAPLAAVEVLSPDSAEEIRAKAPDMTFIRSSDAHSPAEIGRRTTQLDLDDATFEAIRDALFGSRLTR